MAQYAVNCAGVTRVLDQHNAVYLIPQRLARNEANPLKRLVLEREWRALAAYEAAMCYRFDQVITVTEEDRALLSDLCNRNRLFITPRTDGRPFHVIPICVDPEERPLVRRHPDAKRVTILGTMFWPPNVEGVLWFTEQVWPLVLRTVPDAKLTIIGKNPPETVRQLALSPGSNVEVTGYVRNPVPFMEGSAVFAVPLRSAGGMRVKILDAWCWGVPIVSTTIGAEGVEVQDGENILIADAGPAFARVVVSVMQDPGLAERLRTAGRDWVEKKYNWRSIYSQWGQIYG
jgi:glycosyltransferase involved in cell wall biosynthesis